MVGQTSGVSDDASRRADGTDRRPHDPSPDAAASDATRRTYLASERTFLAWFRTALASLALAITIGRVLPEITEGDRRVFQVVGLGFGLVGLGVLVYGAVRERMITRALADGRYVPFPFTALVVLTGAVFVLGIVLVVLIWA